MSSRFGSAAGARISSLTDTLAGSDPGFNRLVLAVRGALSIALVLLAEWILAVNTEALGPGFSRTPISRLSPAILASERHDAIVIVLLLGGLVALMGAMNANEPTMRGQLVTLGYVGLTMAAALVLGLFLGPHRVTALVVMVVLLTGGTYCRRFGPRGAMSSVLLFTGYFVGFFLSPEFEISSVGWLACVVAVAVFVSALVRVVGFRQAPERSLSRAFRSFSSRSRQVVLRADQLFEGGLQKQRGEKVLGRQLVRLNEAALIIEGQLAQSGLSTDAVSSLRQHLFDVELATTNLARFADALAETEITPRFADPVRRALDGVASERLSDAEASVGELRHALMSNSAGLDEKTMVVLYRFTQTVEVLVSLGGRGTGKSPYSEDATSEDPTSEDPTSEDSTTEDAITEHFQPAVSLRAGWLPGSADVSAEASNAPSGHLRIPLYVRSALQVGVATGVAILAGDALDPPRFYWAVIAALLALVGTNTSAEQIRKAGSRVVGTLGGILVGAGIAELVGHNGVWSVVVVVVALFLGMYLFRVEYAAMAMAITISLSQVYLSLGEFSAGLLAQRLLLTTVGAGAAILTVLVVVPLRTGRVIAVAAASLVEALEQLVRKATSVVSVDASYAADLRSSARRVDAAYQALVQTAQPLSGLPWSDPDIKTSRLLASATAARNYGKNVVIDAVSLRRESGSPSLGPSIERLDAGIGRFESSAKALRNHLCSNGDNSPYVRAASLFANEAHENNDTDAAGVADEAGENVGAGGPAVLFYRDLMLLDGAFASMASASGLDVTDLDTKVGAEKTESRSTP